MRVRIYIFQPVSVRCSDLCSHGAACIPAPVPSPLTAARAEGTANLQEGSAAGQPRGSSAAIVGSTVQRHRAHPAGERSAARRRAAFHLPAPRRRRTGASRARPPPGAARGAARRDRLRPPGAVPCAGRGEREPPLACRHPAPCAARTWRGRGPGGRGLPRAAGAPRHLLRRPERAAGGARGRKRRRMPTPSLVGPGERADSGPNTGGAEGGTVKGAGGGCPVPHRAHLAAASVNPWPHAPGVRPFVRRAETNSFSRTQLRPRETESPLRCSLSCRKLVLQPQVCSPCEEGAGGQARSCGG